MFTYGAPRFSPGSSVYAIDTIPHCPSCFIHVNASMPRQVMTEEESPKRASYRAHTCAKLATTRVSFDSRRSSKIGLLSGPCAVLARNDSMLVTTTLGSGSSGGCQIVVSVA